ncbi:MAG: hypothetical protein ABFS46_11340 [Myxococcota bacterium]
MEKLIYALWKPEAVPIHAFRSALLEASAARLSEAGASGIKLLLADEWTEPLSKARIARSDPPIAGALSFWLDCVDQRHPFEAILDPIVARHAGYLVSESVPISNRTHPAAAGERTPGTTLLTFIERPERMSPDQWLGFWHEYHAPMAAEVQCTYLYVRNAVVRRLALDAPAWSGIVEEGFPTEAVTDPMLWYRAEGSREKLRENLGRMLASVRTFLDVERIESLPMSEYVIPDPRSAAP